MSILDMVKKYTAGPRLKGKLLVNVKPFKAGEESGLLIDLGNGEYHFEKNSKSVVVSADEVEVWERR